MTRKYGNCRFCVKEDLALYADGTIWRHLSEFGAVCHGTRKHPGECAVPGRRVVITNGYDGGPMFGWQDGKQYDGVYIGEMGGIPGKLWVAVVDSAAKQIERPVLIDLTSREAWRLV